MVIEDFEDGIRSDGYCKIDSLANQTIAAEERSMPVTYKEGDARSLASNLLTYQV